MKEVPIVVQGWEPNSFTFSGLKFLSGRKYNEGERGVALLGVGLAKILNKKVGDHVAVPGETLKVIGIYEKDPRPRPSRIHF